MFDDAASSAVSMVEAQRQSHAGRAANHDDPRARQIAPQQTWLAKIFHVKPVSRYICFSVNRRRARQEITTVLREWRRYGIRDVEVDKERNIVFGKVATKNCKYVSSLMVVLLTWFSPWYERSCVCRRSHDRNRAWQEITSQHCTIHTRTRCRKQFPKSGRDFRECLEMSRYASGGWTKEADDD